MKKHNYLLLLVSVLCLSVSCSKDIQQDSLEIPASHTRATDPYLIPMDSIRALALSLPQEFSEGPTTRAAGKAIKEIVPFSRFVKSSALTRVITNDAADEDILDNIYVVNYENETGFAILSADRRLQDVLGYSDTGNITDSMPNPGMCLAMELLPDCADRALRGDFGGIYDTFPSWGGGGETPPLYIPETVYTPLEDWHGTIVEPLIKVKWSQQKPFSLYMPTCNTPDGHMPVGCVAIAMIEIMSHHRQPTQISAYIYNWDKLTSYKYSESFPSENNSDDGWHTRAVAFLSEYIGDIVNMKYTCTSSTAFIEDANKAFSDARLGYTTDGITDYSFEKVREDLRNSRPVFMSGASSSGTGHAWVIDGYKALNRKVRYTINYYLPNLDLTSDEKILHHSDSREEWERRELVYCHWGWRRGQNDGWFYPHLFDPDNAVEPDIPKDQYPQDTYDKKLRIIKNVRYEGTK